MKLLGKKHGGRNLLQCILGVAERFFMICLTYQVAHLADVVIAGDAAAFIKALPMLLVTLCLEIALFYAAKMTAIHIRIACSYEIREMLYESMLYDERRDGEDDRKANILNIYNSQIGQLAALAPLDGELWCAVLTCMMTAFYMCTISVKLTLVTMLLVPVSGHIYQWLMTPLQACQQDILCEKKELNRIVKEILDGFYVVRAYDLSGFFFDRFRLHSKKIRETEGRKDRLQAVLGRVGIVLRYIPQLIIPLYGGWLAYHGELSVGELIAANTVIWYLVLPIENMLDIHKKRKEGRAVAENIFTVIQSRDTHQKQAAVSGDALRDVSVEHLNFRYPNGEPVLRDISLHMQTGSHVLLLGESGNGKSTLARILCGLETDYEGEIRLNGKRIAGKDFATVKKQILYVPQDPYIFSGSIMDNICMGLQAEEEQVRIALKISGVERFAGELPAGCRTVVGEGGVQLSGGQRKRIAIARAIIANRDFYLLDEPTASLDEAGASALMEDLMRLWADKMVLIISHNRKQMPRTEAVYILQKGELKDGTMAEAE